MVRYPVFLVIPVHNLTTTDSYFGISDYDDINSIVNEIEDVISVQDTQYVTSTARELVTSLEAIFQNNNCFSEIPTDSPVDIQLSYNVAKSVLQNILDGEISFDINSELYDNVDFWVGYLSKYKSCALENNDIWFYNLDRCVSNDFIGSLALGFDAFQNPLKEEYIDTGKVRFVYRDFPLNQPSLTAAAISICRAYEFDEDNRAQGYHDFVKTMYNTQNSWIFKEDYSEKLVSIAVLEGMDKDLAKKCAKDTQIYDQILQARIIAAKELEIQSTPTFFINGKRVQGFVGYKKIKELIDYELNK